MCRGSSLHHYIAVVVFGLHMAEHGTQHSLYSVMKEERRDEEERDNEKMREYEIRLWGDIVLG